MARIKSDAILVIVMLTNLIYFGTAEPLTIEIATEEENDDIVTVSPVELNLPLQYANYGEFCNNNLDCDASAYLTCVKNSSSCQCVLPTMKFDDTSSSCWVPPGEKCIFRTSDIDSSHLSVAELTAIAIAGGGGGSEERSALRTDRLSFRCVTNSECDNGVCTCDSGYFAMNGSCYPQGDVGDMCKTSEGCRSSLHLICENGACGCNSTNSVLDMEHGLCVGLAGSSCFDYELCTKNAYCPSFGIFNQYDVTCTCKPGFYENERRTCDPKHSHGTDCKTNQECREDLNLICPENVGKCVCNDTTHVYDTIEGRCMALIGSSCSDMTSCVINGECTHAGFLNGNILARNMICRCGYGYYENAERRCEKKKEFGETCVDDMTCREDMRLLCSVQTRVCTCNESVQTYDRSKKRCISLAGSYCDRNEQCVFNSACRSPGYLYPRHSPKAMCLCKEGFSKTSDGHCLGVYGSRCESWTRSCMDTLICTRNGECGCPDEGHQQYYDYSAQKCLAYVGSDCNENTTCVLNAHCGNGGDVGILGEMGGEGHCTCDSGYVSVDQGRKCLAKVGQQCTEGQVSTMSYYMSCVPHAKCDAGYCKCATEYYTTDEGQCQRKRLYSEACSTSKECQDNHCEMGFCSCNKETSMFDPVRKSCVRLAGKDCYDLRECVFGSECRSLSGRLNPSENDAVCTCKEGYFQNDDNGTCDWKRSYGESCTENKQCQDAADLLCSLQTNRCECNETIATFDESRRVCLRLAGTSCSSHSQCVAHSKCKNPLYWVHYDSFSPSARCECDSDLGYTNSSDGKCIIDFYGGACDISAGHLCSTRFQCHDGKCVCPFPEHQKYDYKLKTCSSLVKGPCDNETGIVCSKNAHCVVTEEGLAECRCTYGYLPVDRECELTFGQPCSSKRISSSRWNKARIYIQSNNYNNYNNARNEDLSAKMGGGDNELETPCDRLAPLHCVEGTCQCGGFQFYDYELQKCRGLVGSRCELDERSSGFCTEGAFCEAYRSVTNDYIEGNSTMTKSMRKYGRCKCMQNYFSEENRTCSLVILKKELKS